MHEVAFYDLGHAPYRPVWNLQAAIQQRLVDEKLARRKQKRQQFDRERQQPCGERHQSGRESRDTLLFVEHPHIYTLGKSGDKAHLLKGTFELAELEADFIEIDRGGDITYHGPGQIVGYPIFDMDRHFSDIHKYLRFLEEIVIRTCADFNINARRIEGLTGVWVGNQKICAMGIKCSRWVTMHGFALNVNTDLSYFTHIVPCGISDKAVTSFRDIFGRKMDETEVKGRLLFHFEDVFDIQITNVNTLPELDHRFSYLKQPGVKATSH